LLIYSQKFQDKYISLSELLVNIAEINE